MLKLEWLGCDAVTGQIIEELPDLVPQGPISSVLATATSTSFALPIPLSETDRDWQAATQKGRSMIVAVMTITDDEGAVQVDRLPIWAGLVMVRRPGTDPLLPISCASLESYLEGRYVGDHTWVNQDEASVIAAGLFADANVEGLGFTINAAATGQLRDATYYDRDDKTVYSAARALMGLIDGPEWTAVPGWADAAQTTISKTIRVAGRIGTASSTPAAVFSTVGDSDTRYQLVEDYSGGRGANHVVAVSSGQGDSRPQSAPARDEALLAAGWPRWEHRFTPSTSISSVDTLNAHAAAALAELRIGTSALTISARADADPILGRDWHLGDDIGYDLVGHGHPDGLTGVARCIGWQLDPAAERIEPVLALNEEV